MKISCFTGKDVSMENQRIRLSKAMLKEALMRLLKEKPIEKITIYELCSTAQINRTTFYKYYGSQYDVLSEIENEIFFELEQHISDREESVNENLLAVLQYLDMEQQKFLTLVNAIPDQIFSDKLFHLAFVNTFFNSHFFAELTNEQFTDKQKEYIRLFICQGGYAIVRKWLNTTPHDSPREIADLLISLCYSLIQGK